MFLKIKKIEKVGVVEGIKVEADYYEDPEYLFERKEAHEVKEVQNTHGLF